MRDRERRIAGPRKNRNVAATHAREEAHNDAKATKAPKVEEDKVVKKRHASKAVSGGIVRTRKPLAKEIDPVGNAEDPNSFMKCEKSEAQTTAYLHYNDIGAFRRVKLSFPVLEACLWMKEAGPVRRKLVLELMSGAKLDVQWPLGVDVEARYPVVNSQDLSENEIEQDASNRQDLHCSAVAHVLHTFEEWKGISDDEKERRQETAIRKFETKFDLIFPRSDYDIKLVRQPNLRHDESVGECELEEVNRALMLLRIRKRVSYTLESAICQQKDWRSFPV